MPAEMPLHKVYCFDLWILKVQINIETNIPPKKSLYSDINVIKAANHHINVFQL